MIVLNQSVSKVTYLGMKKILNYYSYSTKHLSDTTNHTVESNPLSDDLLDDESHAVFQFETLANAFCLMIVREYLRTICHCLIIML